MTVPPNDWAGLDRANCLGEGETNELEQEVQQELQEAGAHDVVLLTHEKVFLQMAGAK